MNANTGIIPEVTGTYRKTRQGEWVAMISWALVQGIRERTGNPRAFPGHVTVTKRDGSTESRGVKRAGDPFGTAAGPMVFLHLVPKATRASEEFSDGFTAEERAMMRGEE